MVDLPASDGDLAGRTSNRRQWPIRLCERLTNLADIQKADAAKRWPVIKELSRRNNAPTPHDGTGRRLV
jgi:hypothetical protein